MPVDMKFISTENAGGQLQAQLWPRPAYAEGLFSLVQKIYKCLLTKPGISEADPDFGADLIGAVQGISGQEINRAEEAVAGALQKCVSDLAVDPPNDPAQRLIALRLVLLEYDTTSTAWLIDVEVETEQTIQEFSIGV